MARLRLATVEYLHCEPCALNYAGPHCPACRVSTSVLNARRTRSMLIVDDPACPGFQRQERWHCRSCKALYSPPAVAPIIARAARCACGAELFDRAALTTLLAGAATPLVQAQRLVAAIKRRKHCRACGVALTPPCWCPVCAITQVATSSTLPLRPTWVFVPTGYVLEELSDRIADSVGGPEDDAEQDAAEESATENTAGDGPSAPAPAPGD